MNNVKIVSGDLSKQLKQMTTKYAATNVRLSFIAVLHNFRRMDLYAEMPEVNSIIQSLKVKRIQIVTPIKPITNKY